jgi:anti-anti-sigma factor
MPSTPAQPGSFEQRLHSAIAELGERYRAVLPHEAVAEIVQAAARIVRRDARVGADDVTVAERVVARAKADLAMAVGAPVDVIPHPPTRGMATAWTYLLDGVALVRAVGEFDLDTDLILREELTRAVGSGRPAVLVDLGRVSFMDQAGLAPLVAGARWARRAGQRMLLLQLPDPVRRLIDVSGMADEFSAGEDRRAASGGRAG